MTHEDSTEVESDSPMAVDGGDGDDVERGKLDVTSVGEALDIQRYCTCAKTIGAVSLYFHFTHLAKGL